MKKSSKRERKRERKKIELFQVRDEDRIIKQSYSAPTEREAIRAQCKSEGIPQNNISQCPTLRRRRRFHPAKSIDDSAGTTFGGGDAVSKELVVYGFSMPSNQRA